jgi:hypothetical protein
MPCATLKIMEADGQTYLTVLLPNLKGIDVAKLK